MLDRISPPKTQCVLLVLLFIAFSTAVADNSTQNEPLQIQLFEDTQFERGFRLSYTSSKHGRKAEAILNLGNSNNIPIWRLCQWGSRFSLADAEFEKFSDGTIGYRNIGKSVHVAPPGFTEYDLLLEVLAGAEYDGNPRQQGESWPHILVEQNTKHIHTLETLLDLHLHLSVKLSRFKQYLEENNPQLHAAQFQLFLIVKNINPQSEDHRDFFWFGVPIFDNRNDFPPPYMAKDGGKKDATGKFIYTIDGKNVIPSPVKSGEWIVIDSALLRHVIDGLRQAKTRGYLSTDSLSDYAVVNMNMGWEVPGIFDVGMKVKDFSLHADIKP